jgi:hypothetical protein
MKYRRTMVAAMLAELGTTASAESPPQWQGLLVAAIESSAVGECPSTLMEELLRRKCVQDQGAALPKLFAQMGRFQAAHFLRVDTSGGRAAEVYRVEFERGESTCYISATDGGAKIRALWVRDPISYTSRTGS